jgi:hypothetical protein
VVQPVVAGDVAIMAAPQLAAHAPPRPTLAIVAILLFRISAATIARPLGLVCLDGAARTVEPGAIDRITVSVLN